jgi:hypothetical protein
VYPLNFIGGTPESQREFLDTLSSDASNPQLPNEKRRGKVAPVANEFALGYTYQDVLDADQEGAVMNCSRRKEVLSESLLTYMDRYSCPPLYLHALRPIALICTSSKAPFDTAIDSGNINRCIA